MIETEKPRVRIRGIYSTALTKLFLDNGFEIIQPSREIAKRFGLEEERYLSPEIDIYDRQDQQGVLIETLPKYTERITSLFFNEFTDVIIRKSKIQKGAIYKGIIYRPAPQGGFIIKLTIDKDAWLPPNDIETNKVIKLGDPIIVEVKELTEPLPRVTTKITIPGDFAVLISSEDVKVSHKIRGEEREKLIEIGKILRPEGWGIIWRTGAMNAELEELQDEIERLKEEAEKLLKVAEKSPALVQLREGMNILTVTFPGMSKLRLDGIRSEVFPTVRYHHWLKSMGNSLTLIVDFSEKYLVKNGTEIEIINKSIKQMLLEEILPTENTIIKISHKKPRGREVILGPARIIFRDENGENVEFIMYRRFKPGGYYDGIGAPKEPGDYGITIARLFDTKLITAYFNIENKLKGIYVNINTPIEYYNGHLSYIDLEVDVVYVPGEGAKILDNEKLKKHLEEGLISEKLFEFVKKKAEEYKEWVEKEGEEFVMSVADRVRRKLEEEVLKEEESPIFYI